LASSALQKRAPRIAAFLENFSIDPQVLNDLILRIEKEQQPAAQAAKAWVQANPAIVDQWLGASGEKVGAVQ
ncbi:MAG: glycine betaine ABC transporter substrate-binding protein, partial [Pseudomonas chlororaphis]